MEATSSLTTNIGIEKELTCPARVSIAGAKGKSPQARNADYIVILIPQFSLKTTGKGVKRQDLTAPNCPTSVVTLK